MSFVLMLVAKLVMMVRLSSDRVGVDRGGGSGVGVGVDVGWGGVVRVKLTQK